MTEIAPSAVLHAYVDGTSTPAVGNAALMEQCPDGEKRMLRFLGKGTPTSPTSAGPWKLSIVCQADQCAEGTGTGP